MEKYCSRFWGSVWDLGLESFGFRVELGTMGIGLGSGVCGPFKSFVVTCQWKAANDHRSAPKMIISEVGVEANRGIAKSKQCGGPGV